MPDVVRIPSLRMTELDGSPDVSGVEQIYLTSGVMSSLGDGAVLLSMSGTAGAAVTIRDIDGSPTVTPLNTLYVTDGFLSDLGGGNALLSMSGASSGAPTDAEYIVGATHVSLSAERLVTNTATVTWDLGTVGQAKANVVSGQVLLDEEITSGSAATVTLNEGGSPITTAYRHLKVTFIVRSTTTGAKGLRIQFNGDTGANYDWELVSGTDTTATVSEGNGDTSGRVGSITASDGIAGGVGIGTIEIPYYKQTTFNKSAISTGGRANTTAQSTTGVEQAFWRSTAAITSVTLIPDSAAFADGSIFTLYGVY